MEEINNELLKYLVARGGYNGNSIAEKVGISYSTWKKKSIGETDFTIAEAKKVAFYLRMSEEDILNVFFRPIPAQEDKGKE